MAVNKLGFAKTDSYIAFGQETTFGTALSDAAAMTILDTNGDAPSFQPSAFVDDGIRNRGKNIIDKSDYYTAENGQFHRYNIPEFVAPADVLAHFLYGAAQSVTESATTPFSKTYTLNGSVNPDFSSSGGYFASLLIKSPMSSFSQKLTSCVMESLKIKFDRTGGDGRISVSGTALTGRGYTGTSNPSGTHSFSSVAIPTAFDSTAATLSLDGLDMVWYSAEIDITNKFDFVGLTTSGFADNYKLLEQKVSANFSVKYDANSDVLLNLSNSLVSAAHILTIGSASAAGYFKFDANDALYRDISIDRGGDVVQKVNLAMDFAIDSGASQNIVFTVVDGVDQAW